MVGTPNRRAVDQASFNSVRPILGPPGTVVPENTRETTMELMDRPPSMWNSFEAVFVADHPEYDPSHGSFTGNPPATPKTPKEELHTTMGQEAMQVSPGLAGACQELVGSVVKVVRSTLQDGNAARRQKKRIRDKDADLHVRGYLLKKPKGEVFNGERTSHRHGPGA